MMMVDIFAAVFPTLALHDHEKVRAAANEQDRQKKFHQSRGSLRKSESKDSPEKEKSDPPKAKPVKTPPKGV
ncbi:hypothetical protein L9F63_008623, partial [Diploptera punctata]